MTDRATAFVPVEILSVDISSAADVDHLAEALGGDGAGPRALVLVSLCGEPLGAVRISGPIDAQDPEWLLSGLADEVAEAERRHGHRALSAPEDCAWRRQFKAPPDQAEPISIVICTIDHPPRLRATLDTISGLDYPNFELIVVDNAPQDEINRGIIEAYSDRVHLRYVVEPVRGLSRARNAGLRASRHAIVAFTDDDVLIERNWLWGVRHGFGLGTHVGMVSGPVLPAEIASAAQDQFEGNGGHGKGRGFRRAVFGAGGAGQSPYFPLPPFGVGCNMSFRRAALEQAGGFDNALGAGTAARAAEDTAAVSEVLLAGWQGAWEPAAVMWHFHRRGVESLHVQSYNYGIGLGAYYAALLARDPRRIWPLLKLAPDALQAISSSPAATPGLKREQLVGSVVDRRALLKGPAAYVKSRRQAALITRPDGDPGAGLVPILMYHAVEAVRRPSEFDRFVHSRAEFASHLDALQDRGYQTVTGTQVTQAARGLGALPAQPVAITFDDAFTDFLDSAVPELLSRGMAATLFVPTAFVGRRAAWLDEIGEGDRMILSAEALRSIVELGIECGVHSRTHVELDRVGSGPQLAAETRGARAELEQLLGTEVNTFAYPFGYHSRAARRAVRAAGYQGAFAVSERISRPASDDVLALPRLGVPAGISAPELLARLDRRGGPVSDATVEAKRLVWRLWRSVSSAAPRAITGPAAGA